MKVGAQYIGQGKAEFVVWAPFSKEVVLKLVFPEERMVKMEKDGKGYWRALLKDVKPGMQYIYKLDKSLERPDPASFYQPLGVHESSAVVDHSAFKWGDEKWKGIPLDRMIMYEIHVGTFTPEGNFDAVIGMLDDLKDLGVNAIELMPVAQFPGERNWGYDGVHPYAVQNTYGGPEGLKKLVDAAHRKGMAVILDVVYNHLGPEGNYLKEFGPYFTHKYETPWGEAVNYDDSCSDDVRNFFIENALYWFEKYHIDALRIDAIHGIYDFSATPFLMDLAERVEEYSKKEGRKHYLIVESDLNDARVIRPAKTGGYGLDAQWNDDYHHCVHTLLTGESNGYYVDFGKIEHLVKSLKEGFVYSGLYSKYRGRRHGNSSADRPASQFIVFSQNHDQVGNRMLGDRLSQTLSFEELKLAAGLILLSPYIPLIFMGEEYGEVAPFLYFTSHSDKDLIEAVRDGRKKEFSAFAWDRELPDPQDEKTFLVSKIDWEKRDDDRHKMLLELYRALIELRKTTPALSHLSREDMEVYGLEKERLLLVKRRFKKSQALCIFNLNKRKIFIDSSNQKGRWKKVFDSSLEKWGGKGSVLPEILKSVNELDLNPTSFAVYRSG